MTYSMLNMPVLGFDLCRLSRGVDVADVLLSALRLDREQLHRVARQHPGAAHRARWRQVERLAKPRTAPLRELGATLEELGADALVSTSTLLAELERSPIGSLDSLIRLACDEILDWTWSDSDGARRQDHEARAACEVLADALAALYAADALPEDLTADLCLPWAQAARPATDLDLGPNQPAVQHVLTRLTTLDAHGRTRLRAAAEADSERRQAWALAVHDASWAVHLTDRTRAAAAAQLLTVQAFRRGGLTAHDGAGGLWNAVSGLVHSLVVVDLLTDETCDVLQGFWRDAFGVA